MNESGSRWRLLLAANLLALIPLAVGIVVLWLPYQVYAALGAPLALLPAPDWSSAGFGGFALVVIGGSMLLHEAIHGAALVVMGYRLRFGYGSGYLYASAGRGQFLTRRAYLSMVLAPLMIMSLVGGIILPFLPVELGQSVVLALLLNAAASIGDLAVAQRLLRWPPETLFTEAGNILVFTRDNL